MTFNPQPLIRILESRVFAVMLIVIAAGAMLAGVPDAPAAAVRDCGLGLPSPSEWFASPQVSLWVNFGAELLALLGIALINRAFNLFRGLHGGALLMGALYMFMQGATDMSSRFSGGTLLALLVLVAVAALFSIYQRPDGNRRIFLVFALFGAGALTQYGFLPYLLVLMLGVVQMRVMSPRAIIAILAGIATPVWIMWGSGLVQLHPLPPDMFARLFDPGLLRADMLVAAAGVVALFGGFLTGMLDMVQIYARNAITRARFGLLASTGILTGILCIVDFGNIGFYLPLLNLTTAFFATLLFSLRPRGAMGAGTVAVALLTLLFAALYVWKTIDLLAL